MSETTIPEPDAEQQGYNLLRLAQIYLGDVLEIPGELHALRSLVAEQMLEVGMLRLHMRELQEEVRRLKERK